MMKLGPNWRRQVRVWSGLILFTFVFFHLLNASLAVYDIGATETAQRWRLVVTQSWLGTVVIYGALLVHLSLGLEKLFRRRTFRMPGWELTQILLGLAIPGFLIGHLVSTRYSQEVYGVIPLYSYELTMLWPKYAWSQTILIVVAWLHGCLGVHFWLRFRPGYRELAPYLLGIAVLIPAGALMGMVAGGVRIVELQADPEAFAQVQAMTNFPNSARLRRIEGLAVGASLVTQLVTLALIAFVAWRMNWRRSRGSVRISYVYGPEVRAAPGPTLLEISRLHGVPHTSLCGGRGRCSTCRVRVASGLESLPPPDEAEARVLANVEAGPDERLACQIHPSADLAVQRLFTPERRGTLARDHRGGEEGRRAVLFLDVRDFTRISAGRLPYDVVFLLNRFFDAVTPEVERHGGRIDKYLGDGFLAIFADRGEVGACRAALDAAAGIDRALEAFNAILREEGHEPLRIGIGVHVGDLVLGAIGSGASAAPTIIGEAVNAASRLEALTKELGVQMVASETAAREAGLERFEVFEREVRGIEGAMRLVAFTRAREAAGEMAA